MKIDTLLISNFRGIEKAEIREASNTIIIAGQNGSGKSCVFDAIRLLKSVYGGYHQNEWQNWFGEFQINPNGNFNDIKGFFNNYSLPVNIDCYFKFRDEEKSFINNNASSLLEESIWKMLLPEAFQWGGYRTAMFAAQFRERRSEVMERVNQALPILRAELQKDTIHGHVEMVLGSNLQIIDSPLLSTVFTNFRPKDLGVIDFHGAQRHYGREMVQGINLNLEQQTNQSQSQHALYNYSNKYANVKSEMASSFVRELLSEKAGTESMETLGLTDTLKELFLTFFPGKEFLGPQPTKDGRIEFPVRTKNGSIHDLDELSAGEKEILYGYLRIRSSAPKNSIILLDEPELHLNPRLIRNLPEFYRKHLGDALNNQIWLVTHSDAILREAVGKPNFDVFHMFPCGQRPGGNQLHFLNAAEDLDLAMADLVGDLAAYFPRGNAIIFEGGGDTDFDQQLVSRLFPEELAGFNLISGSNKTKVTALHSILNKAYSKGNLPIKFFAIVDKDSSDNFGVENVLIYSWDVYHIENYLIEPKYILHAMKAIENQCLLDEEAITDRLRTCARNVVPKLLRQQMRHFANDKLVKCIDISFDPAAEEISNPTFEAVDRSIKKINNAAAELSKEQLLDVLEGFKAHIDKAFADGTWKNILPGREILKSFVQSQRLSVGYEPFKNLIVSKMADDGHKPLGMTEVINRILQNSLI